jgi:hypothetical protein
MAVVALTNASVVFNSVDLSDHVSSVTVDATVAELDVSAMGSGGWSSMIAGQKNGSIAIEFFSDTAAASVDATLWAALGTDVVVVVKADAGTVTATNPSYTGTVMVNGFTSGGSFGEVSKTSRTFPLNGALVRAET